MSNLTPNSERTAKVRYVLESSIRVGYSKPDYSKDNRIDIPTYTDFVRFVDIIDQDESFILVNIFLKDGDIEQCWLAKTPIYPLELYRQELLFDGRFNSSQQIKDKHETIKPKTLAVGSLFIYDNQQYRLGMTSTEGWQWLDKDNRYCLNQAIYLGTNPTLNDVSNMARYLIKDNQQDPSKSGN